MIEYLVISNRGYDGYGLSFIEGEQELFEALHDPDIEFAFPLDQAVDLASFKATYLENRRAAQERNKTLVEQAKLKLTAEEIEALGLAV